MQFYLISLLFVSQALASDLSVTCGLHSSTICMDERQFLKCGVSDRLILDSLRHKPLAQLTHVLSAAFLRGLNRCPAGTVCADVPTSCTPIDQTSSEVPTASKCDRCNEPSGIACTSLSTFRRCHEGRPVGSEHVCPAGQRCNYLGVGSPCEPIHGVEVLCWRPTPQIADTERQKFCAINRDGIFYDPSGNGCRRAIRCFRNASSVEICSEGEAFDFERDQCRKEDEFTCLQGFCHAVGSFPHPSDPKCTKYVDCDENGQVSVQKCPSDAIFDPISKHCSKNSNFECRTAEILEICRFIKGKFPDLKDKTCKGYIMCYKDRPFLSRFEKCPEGELFDPDARICRQNYVCEAQENPYKQICFDYGISGNLTLEKENTSSYISCDFDKRIFELKTCPEDQTFDNTSKHCIDPWPRPKQPDIQNITSLCKELGNNGLIADITDNSCRTYIQCHLAGDYVTWKYLQCDNSKIFDDELKVCLNSTEGRCDNAVEPLILYNLHEEGYARKCAKVLLKKQLAETAFADPLDPSKFILCYNTLESISWRRGSCYDGYVFHKSFGVCMKDEDVPEDERVTLVDPATVPVIFSIPSYRRK